MGGTAARSLLGKPIKVNTARGDVMHMPSGRQVLVTIHPSALLRLRDSESRAVELARLVADLRRVGDIVPAVRI